MAQWDTGLVMFWSALPYAPQSISIVRWLHSESRQA
jgi:hypothetical protein